MHASPSNTISPLIEPLTRRELDVLGLLAQKLTDPEIAKQLTLGLSTVKWHTRQIYAKLEVNRRSEAIERARELNLLQLAPSPIPKNNLPVPLTSFIGREKEIAELCHLLKKKNTRLLTLTGSGGTGKTRLALQIAGDVLETFSDGVWLIELAPLADPRMVPQAVIAALGQVEQPGKTPMTQLGDLLREKDLLLILDNCEHLVTACAQLAAALLQAVPRLKILASSREILGVAGEQAYRVPPLGMPDPHLLPPLEELAGYDAVHLFVERAREIDPAFTLNEGNAPAVIQITQRLDGIPLALELAAARLRVLSVNQIAERLDDAFRLLTGGSRTALPRHQTLTALIDWSYNLLSPAERGLLRLLSVFAGSWTLEAAEEVCGGDVDVLALLGQLADKSLIFAMQIPGGEMRYRMLETVRQYAHSRLVEAGEAEAVRKRHMGYYLSLGEQLEPKLRGREQIAILDTLGRELDNLRLALEWALQLNDEAELRLAAALLWFWHIRHNFGEEIMWLGRGLEAEGNSRGNQTPAGARALVRAKALTCIGLEYLMFASFNSPKARIALEEAQALYRAAGPAGRRGLPWALVWLGNCIFNEGDPDRARGLAEEAQVLFLENGDRLGMAESLQILGWCEPDPARARKLFLEQQAIDEADGDVEGIATALTFIGSTFTAEGDYAGAIAANEASRELYQRVGDSDMVAWVTENLSLGWFFSGNFERTALNLEEALAKYREMASDGQIANCLFLKSLVAIARGCYDQVAELIDELTRIHQKTLSPGIFTRILYLRSRLARLDGEASTARRYTEEGMTVGQELGSGLWFIYLELAYLAMQVHDLPQASSHLRGGRQVCADWYDRFFIGFLLDGLAVLAVREEKLERAARLFGTRLWRGTFHTLSPIERLEREADFAKLRDSLGTERFEQLREEGRGMSFMQVLALAQEE